VNVDGLDFADVYFSTWTRRSTPGPIMLLPDLKSILWGGVVRQFPPLASPDGADAAGPLAFVRIPFNEKVDG
jgi:hypothetical protein